jgi:D-alanyl-D-alanine carboxypeptidase
MKKTLFLFEIASIIFLFLFLINSCSDEPVTSGHYFSPEIQQQLENVLTTAMEYYNIPGGIAGVNIPGEGTWIKARGVSNIETGEILRQNQTFRIGSITKTFTTTVILQLVDEGRLILDDTLDRFVPSVPSGDKITIRQLCGNTSGLFNYSHDEKFAETLVKNNYIIHFTPQELIDIAISHEPLFSPGTGYSYSNTNFILQGMIIEQITGNDLEEEIKKRIITPLGLHNTTFPKDHYMTGDYSRGYIYEDMVNVKKLKDMTYIDPSMVWAAGAMISNIEDLFIWAKALGEGTLLSENTQKERLKWSPYSVDGPLKYGLGIYYVEDFIGHDGATIGYNTAMFYLPEKKATIVVLLNNETDLITALRVFARMAGVVLNSEK